MEPNESTDQKEVKQEETAQLKTTVTEIKIPTVKAVRQFDAQQHGYKTVIIKEDGDKETLTGNRANNPLEIAKFNNKQKEKE